ncbi:MAG: methyltransferase domain-containing protein [Chitinophagaceae bacterium]|nr:MAG: methyltransferase domain-containing protein [Chitinophagaceae bacterium]
MTGKSKLFYTFNPNLTYPLYLIRHRLLQSLQHFIPRFKGRVLDFGCGVKPYEPLFDVTEYIGVDYAGEGDTYPKDKVDFLYDGKTLPFADNYFDGVFTTEVAEHIFNLPEIMIEVQRVIRPGGLLLLTCPFTMPEHEMPNDYARYTSASIRYILEQSGFKVLEAVKTGNFVESVFQLWIIYADRSFVQRFQKIPVLRSAIRTITFVFLNSLALFCSWIMPTSKELYLNNVVLAQKNAA